MLLISSFFGLIVGILLSFVAVVAAKKFDQQINKPLDYLPHKKGVIIRKNKDEIEPWLQK